MQKEKESIMDKTIELVQENGKEVCYAKVTSGKREGAIIRVYYIRANDGVVVGKDIQTKKVIAVGKGSMSEEFRAHYNLTTGRKGQSYDSILAELGKAVEAVQEEVPEVVAEPEMAMAEASVVAPKKATPRKRK